MPASTSTAHKICSLCCKNAQETKLKKCSGCLEVRYCSKECQATAWYKGHKVSCKDFGGLKEMVASAKIVKLGGGAFAVEHCPEISPELRNCYILKKDQIFETLDNAKQYAEAARDMFAQTDTPHAPWHVLSANDKKHARVEVLKHIVLAVERALA